MRKETYFPNAGSASATCEKRDGRPVRSAPMAADEHLRPGRPRLLRAINERAVLEHLRAAGPASRTELAAATGVSKPTVGQALANLERAGLVRAAGQRTGERGRSASLYELDPTAAHVAGVDVGRSWVRVAIADLAGEVVGRRDERNRARTAGALVERVRSLAHEVVAEAGVAWADVVHTVVGSPGVLDPATGRMRYAPNLPGWGRAGLVDELRGALTPSLAIDNDTNLAALGERAYGHGREVDDFVYLSIGTGVGMGIVVGGELHRGARGAAGEVGFLPLADGALGPAAGGRPARGALEDAAAAGGLVRTGRELGMKGTVTAERIFGAALAGDATAVATVEREAERLAVVVAAVAAIVDPEVVILGGGIGANAELLLPRLERAVARLTPLRLPIVLSTLGADAILLGATATALDTARDLVFSERAGDGRMAAS
jgi:predicted NBD/HSP70 family sugar kinase